MHLPFRKKNKHFPKLNQEIYFEPKISTKKKIKKEEILLCSICYQEKTTVQYINCIKGCIQDINFGKGSQCLKCICKDCKHIIREKKQNCPFCRNHELKKKKKNKFPKKKKPFYQREHDRKKRLLRKYKENRMFQKYKKLYKEIYGYYPNYKIKLCRKERYIY
jgi:hypothetical protein